MIRRISVGTAAVGAWLALCPAPALSQAPGVVGGWTHSGAQSELVIRSRIQQRAYSMPGDFSLGGSMGAGSPTNMVISTAPVPTQVRRMMALIIQPDGRYSWMTEKRYDESEGCEIVLHQEKVGRVSFNGDQATFRIDRGSDRSVRTCGEGGGERDRAGDVETYTITRSEGRLRISDGTVSWVFDPHAG